MAKTKLKTLFGREKGQNRVFAEWNKSNRVLDGEIGHDSDAAHKFTLYVHPEKKMDGKVEVVVQLGGQIAPETKERLDRVTSRIFIKFFCQGLSSPTCIPGLLITRCRR
jgi:hypothetical protein